jgi:hypothetical protein
MLRSPAGLSGGKEETMHMLDAQAADPHGIAFRTGRRGACFIAGPGRDVYYNEAGKKPRKAKGYEYQGYLDWFPWSENKKPSHADP